MKRRWLFVVLVGIILAGTALAWPREREPRYKGRSLSSWLALYEKRKTGKLTISEIDGPPEALRQIGTNALPWLLNWIQCEPGPLAKKLGPIVTKLPAIVRNRRMIEEFFRGNEHRAQMAFDGFELLGSSARPAIPNLIELYTDTAYSEYAGCSLMCIGQPAFDSLVAALSNEQQTNRCTIARLVGLGPWKVGTDRARAVSVLVQCLQEPDAKLVKEAVQSLGRLHLLPDLAVPALISRLQNKVFPASAAQSLVEFGDAARPAIPALIHALNENIPLGLSYTAIEALGQLALDPEMVVPALTTVLQSSNSWNRYYAAQALGHFAHRARSAGPSLLQILQDPDEEVRRVTIQALWHISPERLPVVSRHGEAEKFCGRYGLEPFSFFEPEELPQIVAEILRKNGLGPDQVLSNQSR